MRVDTDAAAPEAYLGALGGSGLTAYVGLFDVACLREGDVVWVSAAAGSVGSLVAQMAKIRGHRVIGSAGSDAKVSYLLDELGLDAAFNHKAGPLPELLRAAAPDGIDVYFDNVGGDHLEAAIGALRRRGRVALCGAISEYDASRPAPGPSNLFLAVANDLTLRGFRGSSHVTGRRDDARDRRLDARGTHPMPADDRRRARARAGGPRPSPARRYDRQDGGADRGRLLHWLKKAMRSRTSSSRRSGSNRSVHSAAWKWANALACPGRWAWTRNSPSSSGVLSSAATRSRSSGSNASTGTIFRRVPCSTVGAPSCRVGTASLQGRIRTPTDLLEVTSVKVRAMNRLVKGE